ncbi:MAG: isoprenyl transferase [Fimbriiglobus sp.]
MNEYASQLSLDPEKLPRHIAIIMDGNGRWAQERGEPRIAGHMKGAEIVRRTVTECCKLGIRQLTLYCFSAENWKRPAEEVSFLMRLLKEYLLDERELILKENIRFRVIGRREPIPADVLAEMDENIRLSQDNTGLTLCLAINYGSRTEMLDAVRKLAIQVRDGQLDPDAIDESTFDAALYTAGMPEPDLLIRTAGEMRISNYLLWQISYAELWVTPLCWPDFEPPILHTALTEFAQRNRRFGGLVNIQGSVS